jgi:hypothetical protein
MSRPRYAALRLDVRRCGVLGEPPALRASSGRRWRQAVAAEGRKSGFVFPSMLPLLSSPLEYFSFLHALGAVSRRPDWYGGFRWRWDLLSPTTFYPCGLTPRHPILSASCDESWKAYGRRPHLSDGFFTGPEVQRAASTSTKAEV